MEPEKKVIRPRAAVYAAAAIVLAAVVLLAWGVVPRIQAPEGASPARNGPNDYPNPYEAQRFGRLPEGRRWGAVIGVFADADGNVWVFERCGANTCLGSDLDPVLKFDAEGNLLTSFGGGMFAWPHGFFVDHEGSVWVTDASGHWLPEAQPLLGHATGRGHSVVKFSPEGEVLLTLGEPGVAGAGRTHFSNPSDVAVALNGDIYVVDGHKPDGNNRIVRFDRDGRYLQEWGRKGSAEGEFDDPHGIAIDASGRLFVADRINNRIQIFGPDGDHRDTWFQFGRPSGIFIDGEGTIYVADSESNAERNPGWRRGIRVGSVETGTVRYLIPDPEPDPDRVGTSGAEYVAVDTEGSIYAAEVGPRDLKKYVRRRVE